MKQLKNRLRSLLVLFAAVLLVSQGMFAMPVEAASGEEYLIVMQEIQTDRQKLVGSAQQDPPSGGTSPMCNDGRILGIYKSTTGKLTQLIDDDQNPINNSNVRDLKVEGVTKVNNIGDIKVETAAGATLYCLTYGSSGYGFQIDDQNGNKIADHNTTAAYKVGPFIGEDANSNVGNIHNYYKIENFGGVLAAKLIINKDGAQNENYFDYDASSPAWTTISQRKELDVMSDSKTPRATADTNCVHHYLKIRIIDPAKLKTITVDTDGGSKIDPITQEVGTPVTKPADPTKEGYTFDGWEPEFPSVMPDTDVTIKAKWKQNAAPVVESTITYDLKGGKLDGAKGKVTKKYANGTVITLPEPTREGYTFEYWKGSKYEAGDTYTVNGDHTFTAVWKSKGAGKGSSTKGADTGDENDLGFWIFLMSAALIGAAGMAFVKTRRR